jgi:hypothetical protein
MTIFFEYNSNEKYSVVSQLITKFYTQLLNCKDVDKALASKFATERTANWVLPVSVPEDQGIPRQFSVTPDDS